MIPMASRSSNARTGESGILWQFLAGVFKRTEGRYGYHRGKDNRTAVAVAGATASQRLCCEGPRGQPPVFRESARYPAGRDMVRKELQRRDAAGGRVLSH